MYYCFVYMSTFGYWDRSSHCDRGYQTYKSQTNYAIWRMNIDIVLQYEKHASDYQSTIYITTINEYEIHILVTHNHDFAEYVLLICNVEHIIST